MYALTRIKRRFHVNSHKTKIMSLLLRSNPANLVRITQNKNNRISSQKHFADIPILIDRTSFLRSLASLWNFCPHFLHIFQNHVAVSIKRLYSSQELVIVSAIYQYLHTGTASYTSNQSIRYNKSCLSVLFHAMHQYRQRPRFKLFFLVLINLH